MMKSRYWFGVLFGLLCSPALWAATETVALTERSATDVLAALQPHLGADVKVSRQEQLLILSGPQSQLDEAVDLIHALDRPKARYIAYFARSPVPLGEGQARQYTTARIERQQVRIESGETVTLSKGFVVPVSGQNIQGGRVEGYQYLPGGIQVSLNPLGQNVEVTLKSSQVSRERGVDVGVRPGFENERYQGSLRVPLNTWVQLGGQDSISAMAPSSGRQLSTDTAGQSYFGLCIESLPAQQGCGPH